ATAGVADKADQPVAKIAADTTTVGQLGHLRAGRTAFPKRRVGPGARGTQRPGDGATAHRSGPATTSAAGPALLTCPTPRLASRFGDLRWREPPPDRTGHLRDQAAAHTSRTLRTAYAHGTAPSA